MASENWNWTELPSFASDVADAFPDVDISELDLIRWEIMETVLRDPLAGYPCNGSMVVTLD